MDKKEKNFAELSQLARKWDKGVIDRGWVGVPNLLLEHQGRLQISSSELNVLLALMKFWWSSGHDASPSIKTIANMLGKTEKTIQNNIRSLSHRANKPNGLEKFLPQNWKGFITVYRRKDPNNNGNLTNLYLFQPLVAVLHALDEEQKVVKEDRQRRKPRINLEPL
jgi:hypothetical protein